MATQSFFLECTQCKELRLMIWSVTTWLLYLLQIIIMEYSLVVAIYRLRSAYADSAVDCGFNELLYSDGEMFCVMYLIILELLA